MNELRSIARVLSTTHTTAFNSGAREVGTPVKVLLVMLIDLPQNIIRHAGLAHPLSIVTPLKLGMKGPSSCR
jgi:hypothetical protein